MFLLIEVYYTLRLFLWLKSNFAIFTIKWCFAHQYIPTQLKLMMKQFYCFFNDKEKRYAKQEEEEEQYDDEIHVQKFGIKFCFLFGIPFLFNHIFARNAILVHY